jgi:hypothetical protein
MGQDVAYCDAFLTVGPKRTRSRLPSTPGIGPATRRHSSTTAKRVGLDPGAGCIYQAQCQEGLCRSSERGASVATERCRPRLPAPCGSWCKLRSAFKCRRPRSSGGAQSGHPRISLPRSQREDHSIMDLRALADAMPEGCRAIVITQASLGLRVAELMVRRVPEVDGIRRGWNSRQPRTASSQYRRRHQDHDAPCHCRIWSGKALAKHIAEFPQVEDGSLSTTANGNRYRHQHHGAAHLRSGRPRDRLAPRVTLVNGHGRSKVLGTSRTPASRRSADHDHMRPVPAFPLSFGSLSLRGRSLAALVTHNGA